MSIFVKNIATSEVTKVADVKFENGKIIATWQRPEPGVRFYNANKSVVRTEETIHDEEHNVERRVMALADGYELAQPERKPRAPRKTRTTKEETKEETKEAEVIETIQPETAPEALEPIAEVTDEQPVTPKAPAKGAGKIASARGLKKVAEEEKKAADMPTLDAATQAFAALTPLFSGVQANVTTAVMNELQPMIAKVEAICGRAPQIIKHVIKTEKGESEAATGEVYHANFDAVCNRIARGSWVYLYGPTGSGKNVMAEQIAKALGLNFYYQAHTLDRFELTGFIDANGNYQPSEFYKAYTGGGLFMLDELDGSDENALVTLNSASNGYFAFPCGTVKAHPDFRVIAAGNTCGRGGTDDYTARRVMDISSLGRFIPRFHGYCQEIDMAAANGDAELVDFIHSLRDIKTATGCQIIASPRQIKEIVKDEAQGLELTDTLADMFGTYLTADELNIVKDALKADEGLADNKYAKAFKKVRAVEY